MDRAPQSFLNCTALASGASYVTAISILCSWLNVWIHLSSFVSLQIFDQNENKTLPQIAYIPIHHEVLPRSTRNRSPCPRLGVCVL